ncbi:hypothetical protein HNR24_000899 [Nesterenkonia jeotgali]|uniref:Uncharacterized protein n=1 Tax=Nesterenkonia jeotgali TaxID=317018 RepID=A0A839FM56_9MICC|nr:hypothetical protein [Nesterenkonia jeotgali]
MDLQAEGQAQGDFRTFDIHEVVHLISAARSGEPPS